MYEIEEQQIRHWWQTFKGDGQLVEVRLLGKNTYSGYFTNIETLIAQIKPILDPNNERYYGNLQAYFTLNDINPALYSREQRDIFVKKPKSTTTDGDIVRRHWVLIDLDPNRAAGISASNEEFEKAHLKAVALYRYLIKEGFGEPMITTSGNGYHLYIPCDMPNNDECNELIKRFLQSLGKMFSDGDVEIDEKVFNPARIDKLIGTWAKKGADSQERPWRLAKIVKVPKVLLVNDYSLFQKIADLLPKEEPKLLPNKHGAYSNGHGFELVSWMNQYGIKYREKKSGNSTLYELEECPWIDSHSDHKKWDSALFQDANGKLTFNCTHSHCKDKTWHDVRLHYEPNAYNKAQWHPQMYMPVQYMPQRQKYEIKDEIPELGEKWLSMSAIQKVDLTELEKVKTGYFELDKKIGGLYMSDVTVLSGSNSCVDCDTEYFNGTEWKKISEYQLGEKVLQYNADGSAELVTPQRYIKSPCEELHLLQSVTGVDQCVSINHNLVYMTSKGNLAKKSVADFLAQHNDSSKGFTGKFYTTFRYEQGEGIGLNEWEIRLMCAIICDGHFPNSFKDKGIVRINIKKERKKQRLEMLLSKVGVTYRKEQYNPSDIQYNPYYFHAPRKEKEFSSDWYSCTAEQLAIVADEILYWDGCLSPKSAKSYSSISKKNIDFVQFAFASIGVRTSIHVDDRVGKFHSNGKYMYKNVCYQLVICSTKNPSLINPIKKKTIPLYKPKDGYKYCFTVPSGMLVLRRNGNINITGNSGKSSWLNSLLLNIIQQGYKIALWSGELRADILKTWIQMVAAGAHNLRQSQYDDGRYYVPENIGRRIDEWLDGKFFLYNNGYGTKAEQILNDMGVLLKAGIKVFALDNLMSMDVDLFGGDKNSKQKELILRIKDFAMTNQVHIILVAHPRKVMTFLRKNDISGTSDITNAVDNVFIIHRTNDDFIKAISDFYDSNKANQLRQFGNVLSVEKNRLWGVMDFMCGFHYDVISRRFKNTTDENIHYGWEINPTQVTMQYPQETINNDDPLGGGMIDESECPF